MLSTYRKRHPGSTLAQLIFFDLCREISLLVMRLFFRLKADGIERIPQEGAVLMVANHQSFLDPPAIAVAIRHRQTDFLARGGLFTFKPFGWLIKQLHAMPIKQGKGDAGAMKMTIAKLNAGKMMVVFPEGSRTPDGQMHHFQRGITILLKKTSCQIVPVGIDGAFEAWPRTKKLPNLFTKDIVVCFGDPIDSNELMAQGTDQAIETLYQEVQTLTKRAHGLRVGNSHGCASTEAAR